MGGGTVWGNEQRAGVLGDWEKTPRGSCTYGMLGRLLGVSDSGTRIVAGMKMRKGPTSLFEFENLGSEISRISFKFW